MPERHFDTANNSTDTMVETALATAWPGLPSPLTSPIAAETGLPPVATSVP